jgi:hypothetical protein
VMAGFSNVRLATGTRDLVNTRFLGRKLSVFDGLNIDTILLSSFYIVWMSCLCTSLEMR